LPDRRSDKGNAPGEQNGHLFTSRSNFWTSNGSASVPASVFGARMAEWKCEPRGLSLEEAPYLAGLFTNHRHELRGWRHLWNEAARRKQSSE